MSSKHFFILSLFLCCLFQPLHAQQNRNEILQENPEAEAEIENLVHDLYESLRLKDLEKQKSFHLYSDKFTAFYGGQKRKDAEGAQEYEENLLQRLPEDVQFDIEDMMVNVFENVAVATFHIYVSYTAQEEKQQSRAQLTLVYINVDGEWKITHEHVSALTEGSRENE